MIVRVDDRRYEGRAVDLTDDPGPETVARAVAGDLSADACPGSLAVNAPDPGPVVQRVSPVTPETTLSVGPALAAAARSRGLSAPQDDDLAAVRAELAALDPDSVDSRPARRRVAEVGDRERELHETVAELRGQLTAHRERGHEATADLQRRLREAVADLTEARTERIAAEESLNRAERRARAGRDDRERRLRLVDRRDNLQRAVRNHFLDQLADELADALRAVPGPDPAPAPGEAFDPRSYQGDDATVALAVVRLATASAPVVVACGRFADAADATSVLDAPVIRVARAG